MARGDGPWVIDVACESIVGFMQYSLLHFVLSYKVWARIPRLLLPTGQAQYQKP